MEEYLLITKNPDSQFYTGVFLTRRIFFSKQISTLAKKPRIAPQPYFVILRPSDTKSQERDSPQTLANPNKP